MLYVTTDRLALVTFTLEMLKAALEGKKQLETMVDLI